MTIAVDQTLTCVIEDLDANGTPVTVTWHDTAGVLVSASDTTNYILTPGTVGGNGLQKAELTIRAVKLASFNGQSTLTYKCSVTSSQYPNSPTSAEIEVIANILTYG